MADPAPQQPTTSTPRRRWRRRLVISLIVLVLLVVLAPLALALPFVKNMVVDAAAEALNREVTIESASAFWFKGIDLSGVEVKSPDGFDAPLATVKQVHVDLDLFALLTGTLDADVRVDAPSITFLVDGTGRSNTDGLFEEERATPPESPAPGPEAPEPAAEDEEDDDALRLRLVVVDGVVRARSAPNAPFEEVKDLDLEMTLGDGGAVGLVLTAEAVGAAAGGGDAKIEVDTHVSGAGAGPVKATVPPIDLSRLAAIVEGATGYRSLRGTVSLNANATLYGRGGAAGSIHLGAHGFVLRAPDGPRLAVQRVKAQLEMEKHDAGTAGTLSVRIEHVELLDDSVDDGGGFDGRPPSPRRFREPLITVEADARFDKAQEFVLVEKGAVNAGQALTITVSEPWTIHIGKAPHANGELVVRADLGQLSNLKAFVPALAQIRSGGVGARITADGKDGLDVQAGIRVKDLELASGELSPNGHVEKEIIAYATVTRARGDGDVPLRITIPQIKSSFLTVGPVEGEEGLVLTLQEAGIGAQGATAATVYLGALSNAFGGAMGLKRGDLFGGTLTVTARGDLDAEGGKATLSLDGTRVTVPTRWAEGVPPATVAGEIRVETTPQAHTVNVPSLDAFGLTATANVALARGEGGGLETVDASVEGNLERARALLSPLLGLGAGDLLQGRLKASTKLLVEGDARRLRGGLAVTGLRWLDARRQPLVDEPKVELQHDIVLENDGGRVRFDRLQVTSSALEAKVEGSASTTGDDTALHAKLTLAGDAARLAGVLRRALGEDYRDLTGSGRIDGTLAFEGSTARGGQALLVNGSLKPGAWSTGGLSLSNTVLRVKRAAADQPQALEFDAVMNRGALDFDLAVRPSPGQVPWSLTLKVARVDTAPIAVNQGLGEYLTYFLPTLVPTNPSTQALSGLLDADIEMRADATEQPRLDQTLAGKGFIKMDQGAIGESTLFKSIGGGRGFGKVGAALTGMVPEVGQALTGLQRSLTFSRVESRFTVLNRVVNITKGLLDGERTRIDFRGTVAFNEAVNLKMDLTLAGTAGRRLAQVMPTKKSTIPMTVTGQLASPNVQPDLDAAGLAAGGLGGLIPKGNPKDAIDKIRDLLPK